MIAAIVVVAWGASQCAVELVLDLRHATTSARVINVSPDQRLGSGSATVVFTANGRETTTEVGWAWPDATLRQDERLRIEYNPGHPAWVRVGGRHALTALGLTVLITPLLLLQTTALVVWLRRPRPDRD